MKDKIKKIAEDDVIGDEEIAEILDKIVAYTERYKKRNAKLAKLSHFLDQLANYKSQSKKDTMEIIAKINNLIED